MTEPDAAQPGTRLQKVLASAGVASRRACEQLIAQGRVEVDGRIVREQGTRVDPELVVIKVDGVRVSVRETARYLAVNKPRGMLSAMSDPGGRPCLGDLVGNRAERLFHVGRLDADSEGLLLLTNDGELAHRLMHPSYGVPKTYLAEVTGTVPREAGRMLRAGVELEDGVAKADHFRVVGRAGARVMVEITLHEGRKHIVRRLLAAVGHPVQRLVRTSIGPVMLGELRPGKTRPLTQREVGALFAAVEIRAD
jgi:23S rRNA pseudouridine2605 synthase